MTLHPRHWAERDPERPAIIFEPSGYVLSYGALVNRSNRCAQFLLTRGTAADSTIALLIENHPAFFEIAWAAQNAGIIYTPISWRFQAEEIAFILRDCGATLLFISARQQHLLDILGDALDGVEVVTIGFERAGYVTYDAMLDAQPAAPPPVRARGTDMVYSSGSTGRPKGIRQSLSETPIDALTPLFAIFAERFGWGPGHDLHDARSTLPFWAAKVLDGDATCRRDFDRNGEV
jgi:acyl-CoA synthetase (AMP-forming)/AMP-acid ligase II